MTTIERPDEMITVLLEDHDGIYYAEVELELTRADWVGLSADQRRRELEYALLQHVRLSVTNAPEDDE